MTSRLLVLVLAAGLATLAATAPQIEASRVILLTATDARGRVVIDALPDDFVVEEGGASRDVLSVHQADYPIVLLLDDANAELDAIRHAALRFIGRLGERAVGVGTLTNPSKLVADLSDDRATVLERVRQLPAATTNERAAIQAAAHASTAAKDWGATFLAVVIVSTELDEAAEATKDDVTATLMTALVDSGAIAHIVARAPAEAPDRPDARPGGSGLLRELADATHGQYTRIFSSASYPAALDRLADGLAAELMVEYLVPPRSAGGPVRVGMRIPGVRIQSLTVSR